MLKIVIGYAAKLKLVFSKVVNFSQLVLEISDIGLAFVTNAYSVLGKVTTQHPPNNILI